jgi:hypothetical protein|nr:MAG TPA: hypothetical protein [Caudoviricetes sp.]
MSLMNLLFGTKTIFGSVGVAAIELDALLNETTVMSSQITEYPVEDGTIVSDHITLDSERLTIEGVISGAGSLFGIKAGKAELINAKETLRELHRTRELITIVTGVDLYEDFAIESCSIARNNEYGEQYQVELALRKIKKVTLKTEDMPPEKSGKSTQGKAGKTKSNAGKAKTGTPSPSQEARVPMSRAGAYSGKGAV